MPTAVHCPAAPAAPPGSGFAKLAHSGSNQAPICDSTPSAMQSCSQVEVTSEDVIGDVRTFQLNVTHGGNDTDEIALTLHFSSAPVLIEVM